MHGALGILSYLLSYGVFISALVPPCRQVRLLFSTSIPDATLKEQSATVERLGGTVVSDAKALDFTHFVCLGAPPEDSRGYVTPYS